MGVDIIIPIYNAYDDLQKCLNSLYQHTNLTENRLILINDNSSDDRIRPYLEEQKKDNVIVIHNESNKGFSNNINLGMSQSQERDVILLNSDTIVTKNWVEKMVACAYSDSSIGTVTPLSNNATLCSVPNFCEENTLPEGMSVDQAAVIVEECSLKKYPRITVAHGFCMLVKRVVINTIGMFDAETFGRGYGEENDFCNRAEQMGYIHVMCDDTYIYHSGTKSFVSKEKEAYIREHDRILNQRYPEQMHNNAVHCRDNPNGWVGRNIGMYFDLWNGRKNVLYLLQSDFREDADDHVGGTQLHVKHLALSLRDQMNIFVAARDREYLQVTAYTKEKMYTFRFFIGEKELFTPIHSRKLADIFRHVLNGFKIDLVHVHHTATTSLDIFYEAQKAEIPIIFTAHDFHFVCPNEKLLDWNGSVCIGKKNIDCQKCLNRKKGIYDKSNYLNLWREKHGEVLKICKRIIVPSESAKEILASYYPECASKMQAIEHGMNEPQLLTIDEEKVVDTEDLIWEIETIDKNNRCPLISGTAYLQKDKDAVYKIIVEIEDTNGKKAYLPINQGQNIDELYNNKTFFLYIPNKFFASGDLMISVYLEKDGTIYTNRKHKEVIRDVRFYDKSKFKVAFIGGINEEKGGKIITNIVKQGPKDVEWYVMGGIGEYNLYHLHQENLIKTGYYHPEDISTHLKYHGINSVCILSKWPETFSYTLSESVVNKLPVIVTDIGALGQRTARDKYGAMVSADEHQAANEVIQKIDMWMKDEKEYQLLSERASVYRHKTVQEMVTEYAQLYQQEIQMDRSVNANCESICFLNNYLFSGDETIVLVEKLHAMEERIRKIDNNATIKIMTKITDINFPFKKQMKSFIMRHMK